MRTRPRAALITLTLGACAPCQPWDQVPIDVSAAEDPALAYQQIRSGLRTFAGWTGRDAVCVDEIEVVEDLGDFIGRFEPAERRILLEDHSPLVTVHELCHALDLELGWPSVSPEGEAALLEAAEWVDPELYPTERARLREAFADLCERGPVWSQIRELELAICGEGGPTAGEDFVTEQVYPDLPLTYDDGAWEGRFTLRGEATRLRAGGARGAPHDLQLAAAGDTLMLLEIQRPARSKHAYEATLYVVDEGEVLESLTLPPYSDDASGRTYGHGGLSLLSSDDGAVLLDYAGPSPGTAWQVRRGPLRLEPLPAVELNPIGSYEGFAVGDQLLALERPWGPLSLVDLGGGERRLLVDEAEDRFDDHVTYSVDGDASGAWSLHRDTVGPVLVERSPSGDVLGVRSVPVPLTTPDRVRRLSDGSALLQLWLTPDRRSLFSLVTLHFDPATELWSVPSEGCEAEDIRRWRALDGVLHRVDVTKDEQGHALDLWTSTLRPE